ncbi:MAG: prepilin-type N-terminal cleavage/methylation domain-containing protein [Pseudomonadota bacterium]
MNRWRPHRQRRRRHGRGFSLIEAIVALAVTALTLSLLTGATWGLRLAFVAQDELRDGPVETLILRRALQRWTTAISTDTVAGEALILGRSDQLRMVIVPSVQSGRRAYLAALTISESRGRVRLDAARQMGEISPAAVIDSPDSTRLMESAVPLSLSYLVREEFRPQNIWVDDLLPEHGLPIAIAVERNGVRIVTAPLHLDRSAGCVMALGARGLLLEACGVRP